MPRGNRGPRGFPQPVTFVVGNSEFQQIWDLGHSGVNRDSLLVYVDGVLTAATLYRGTGALGRDQIVLAVAPGAFDIVAKYTAVPGRYER